MPLSVCVFQVPAARICPRGLLASGAHSPGGEEASTADRYSSHNESREDQRRGEMPERLPIS
jgi:hypothetical protein